MLLVFIAIGYFLRRHHDLPDEAGRVLSLLCTLIFAPSYSISNLSKSISMELITEQIRMVGAGFIFLLSAFAVSFWINR
jgi:predicted permease